jgi:hypothetical protein
VPASEVTISTRSKALSMHARRLLAMFAMTFVLHGGPAGAADAVPGGNGGNVALGKNWGPYETFGGSSFRWVANDAEIVVRGNGLAHVTIACEGGPSLGAAAFPLRVLDPSGRQVDHVQCAGKDHPVSLLLPARGETRYVLHVDGGGHVVAHETRVLDFRVFALDAGGTAAGGDVVNPQNGVRLGGGWYPIERDKGQIFRWIDGADAQFFVAADRELSTRLRILAAPGPSAGAAPPLAVVRDGMGKPVFATSVRGVQALIFTVRLHAGENLFTLHIGPTKNLRVPHDPRALNLRVFSIAALR